MAYFDPTLLQDGVTKEIARQLKKEQMQLWTWRSINYSDGVIAMGENENRPVSCDIVPP